MTWAEAMTSEELDSALEEADRRMKAHNGHQFMTVLKTRCVHCGRSPKVKTRCGQWFQTFINEFKTILRQRDLVESR
jgi:hypothetical protein